MKPSPTEKRGARRKIALVTGGAGFIGSNLSRRLLSEGYAVRILDNLSRPRVDRNLEWLAKTAEPHLDVVRADIRDPAAVATAARDVDVVFHLAAQVAVTTSLRDPMEDFEVNARGTLNVLETLRGRSNPPALVFASTNKVYGGLENIDLVRDALRYRPVAATLGVDEERPLAFRSPYGCSKGAADQYVLDYARSYRVPATVFRMSCIYGPRQFGTEEQGWVAHFFRQALGGDVLRIYGDGCQVRDILYVDDVVEAFWVASSSPDRVAGVAFNLGGGSENAVSLNDVLERLADLVRREPTVEYRPWRTADQRWYVSNFQRFHRALGWLPRVSVGQGLARLHAWTKEHVGTDPALLSRSAVGGSP